MTDEQKGQIKTQNAIDDDLIWQGVIEIIKSTAKEVLDEVSQHIGGGWLVSLYEKYGLEA